MSEEAYICDLAGGVALYDAYDSLPRHVSRHYRIRKGPPRALFVHHSGADNQRNGLATFIAMARYHIAHNDWPGIGYHYGITRRPEYDEQGRLVVYRLQPELNFSYHTKGIPNRIGCGLVLQGHLGEHPLTSFQIECLEAFVPWWMSEHGRSSKSDLGWHSVSWKWGGVPKRSCPGQYAETWLKEYVARSTG